MKYWKIRPSMLLYISSDGPSISVVAVLVLAAIEVLKV